MHQDAKLQSIGFYYNNRIVIYTILLLLTVGFLLWITLYSRFMANSVLTIGLRRGYQQLVWDIRSKFQKPDRFFPPFNPIYPITVIGKLPDDKGYIYTFIGVFKKFDVDREYMYLRGFDNKDYSFLLNLVNEGVGSNEKSVYRSLKIQFNSPMKESYTKNVVFTSVNYAQDAVFSEDSVFGIVWHDTRLLKDILSDPNGQMNMKKSNILHIIRYGDSL